MTNSRNLRILIVNVFVLMSGVGAQADEDFMKVCDFCHMDDLPDCNLTYQINMRVNCDHVSTVCALGIDQSFQDFDNLTMKEIDQKQVCMFRDSGTTEVLTTTESTNPTITGSTAVYTTTDGTFMEPTTTFGSPDYQADQATEVTGTFRSDEIGEQAPPPPDGTVTCFVCKSSSEEACLSDVDVVKTIECPKRGGCLTMYSDGDLIRNCALSMRAENVEHCQMPTNTSCGFCPNPKCNRIPWKQCYQCNSRDNPHCALWSNIEKVPKAVCPHFNDKCSVRITRDGDTIRECSREKFKCPEGEMCSICDASLCNAGIYPENRRQCIQCQECEDAQDPSTALPCPRFDPHEQCFLYVTAKSKMIRGCVSDTNEMLQCKENKPKCITCADRNGCNSMSLTKNPSLSCSKCNSKDNPSCAWPQPPSTVTKCQKKVLYYLQETCMMEFNPATQEAVRDCSFDYGACTAEDRDCHTCTGDGCNSGNLKPQECIQCSSQNPDQGNCSCSAEGIPPTKCPQEAQIVQAKGCFSMTKDNITTRGCIAALSGDDLKFCKAEGKAQCDLCMEDGCNNRLAPSSGWRIGQIPWLVVISAIFIRA